MLAGAAMAHRIADRSFSRPFRAAQRFDFNRDRSVNANPTGFLFLVLFHGCSFSPGLAPPPSRRAACLSASPRRRQSRGAGTKSLRPRKKENRKRERAGRETRKKGTLISRVPARSFPREFSFHFARPPTRYFISFRGPSPAFLPRSLPTRGTRGKVRRSLRRDYREGLVRAV